MVNPAEGGACNILGVAFSALGRYQEAFVAYTEAIRLMPGDAVVMSNFLSASRKLGEQG